MTEWYVDVIVIYERLSVAERTKTSVAIAWPWRHRQHVPRSSQLSITFPIPRAGRARNRSWRFREHPSRWTFGEGDRRIGRVRTCCPPSRPRGVRLFLSPSVKMWGHLTRCFFIVSMLSRHSSGRGGIANLSSGKVPYPEGAGNPHGANHPRTSHEHDADSYGRGGKGNISRDHSREPGVRNTHNAPSGLSVTS